MRAEAWLVPTGLRAPRTLRRSAVRATARAFVSPAPVSRAHGGRIADPQAADADRNRTVPGEGGLRARKASEDDPHVAACGSVVARRPRVLGRCRERGPGPGVAARAGAARTAGMLECWLPRVADRTVRRPERPDPQSASTDQFWTSLSVPGPPRPGASDSDPHERRRDHARPPAHSSSVAESRRPAVAAGAFRSRAGRPCGCRAPLPEQSRSRRPAERALPGGLGPGASPTGSRLSCLTAAPHAA